MGVEKGQRRCIQTAKRPAHRPRHIQSNWNFACPFIALYINLPTEMSDASIYGSEYSKLPRANPENAGRAIKVTPAQLVIAGGKGLGMFRGARLVREYTPAEVETPFGQPSGKVSLIEWEGAQFYCFSRHGDSQQLAPSEIPYLANAYALKRLGVKYWISVSLSTALKGRPCPGDVVVPDDYVSWNVRRDDQFFSPHRFAGLVLYTDTYAGSVSPVLKAAISRAAQQAGVPVLVNPEPRSRIGDHDAIVFAGVDGPHTGTMAEEAMLKAAFNHVVSGMTNMTEALVCVQAGIAFAALNFIGGRGMNYGGVERSLAAYLAPDIGGIDAQIVPVLRHVVRNGLASPLPRGFASLMASSTGAHALIKHIEAGTVPERDRALAEVLGVLAM